MLWTIISVLIGLWILGLLFDIGGGIVHILLVVAAIVFLINLFKGRSASR